MDQGFIKLHRKLIEWEWFADSKTFHVFMFLLLNANHADKKWRGVTVKRGQILTGRIKISEATGISQQSVRTALLNLTTTNEITIESTNRFSIVTICNYGTYQDAKEPTNQPTNQRPTNDQPATNQQLTTNKNEKKETKHKYGEYKNVLLTDKEYTKLQDKFNGSAAQKINDMDEGIEMKGYKYKSHYLAILKWERDKQGQIKPNVKTDTHGRTPHC